MVQVTLRKVDSHIHIQVSDSGQGIRADVLPHVFERFRQGDGSATRHHGGLGLGLAIVKNLVEMHGGSVEASSVGEGHGSVFTVRLPLAMAASSPESRGDTPEPCLGRFGLLDGLQVLVVDDEEDARDVVQRLLEEAGANVKTAETAGEALTIIERGPRAGYHRERYRHAGPGRLRFHAACANSGRPSARAGGRADGAGARRRTANAR